jgi:phenylalanyl-tRNA synthetase beta chain
MKISKNWLNEYIKIDDLIIDEIANKLSLSGTSVEEIYQLIDDNIIVSKILNIVTHPNADRLQIATVDDGNETLQIVCGAPNIKVGQIVPLAKIGAVLNGIKIKETEIRGVKSYGMLCSAKELNLSDDHSGIMILNETYSIGEKLSKYFNNDTIIDFEITPNRGDCLSHIGIAREISALTNKPINITKFDYDITENESNKLIINNTEKKLCKQYIAQIIHDVKVDDSPKWLKDKLTSIGQKPINNIVDITNYILFDLGQPLHAFDLNKINKSTINIRLSNNNEEIICLDGISRKLDNSTLVIADDKNPIAIAGIIGGANSEVDNNTCNIILECAEFDHTNIRKSSKKLNISTQASYRYERQIDPNMLEYAINKATKLICEICNGKIGDIVKLTEEIKNSVIEFDYSKINNLLGTDLQKNNMQNILESLGFVFSNNTCIVPSWRHDIECWQDLADEVARMVGYSNFPSTDIKKSKIIANTQFHKKEYIKDILVKNGFSEIYSYPFLSSRDIETAKIDSKNLLEIANPIQEENKYLRNSIIPGLLKMVAKNPSFDPICCFEIGNVFSNNSENTNLAIIASGKKSFEIITNIKNTLSKLFNVNENNLKIVEIKRDDLNRFKIRKPSVFYIEVNIEKIIKNINEVNSLQFNTNKNIIYKKISKFPPATRDFAFLVDNKISSNEILNYIKNLNDNILLVELFDEFTSDKLQNNKSVAYHIWFQDQNKALNDNEINNLTNKIINGVEAKFNAKIRG